MSADSETIDVLWLRPTVGTHISTRRERIREGLVDYGVSIDIVNTSGTDAIGATKTALIGDYDLIVGTVRVGLYFGYPLARLKRLPFVAEVTEPVERVKDELPQPFFRLFSWYERRVLERADARFFVEAEVLERARHRGLDGHLVRNSVWYEKFADPNPSVVENAQKRLEDMALNFDAPLAVYIGGFNRQQHIPEILATVPKCPEWEFLFLGEEGRHADAVTKAAKTHDNVYFPGAVPHEEIPGYLLFGDVGFSLSEGERPLKLLEYGAAGLTVLGMPGRRERIFSEEEVHFIEPTTPNITNALKTIQQNPDQIPATGSALQEYAKENSWSKITEIYYNVFQELIG